MGGLAGWHHVAQMVRTTQGASTPIAPSVLPVTWWVAVALVVAHVASALVGVDSLLLAGAALIAPGFALAGLLPPALRRTPVAVLTGAPVLGLAATSVALISVSTLGVPLTAVSVHVVLALLLAAGAVVGFDGGVEPTPPRESTPTVPNGGTVASRRSALLDLVVLAGVIALALVLAWRVIGELPVPGDDWAKYVLYADEIRNHGSLLLQNELWMGGRPFSEDPGVPSLEGAALLMTGAEPGGLVRVILVLSLLQIAAAFGAARAHFGLVGATVCGVLIALVPATQNILGWHGLANVGALAILALVLAQLGAWMTGRPEQFDRRAEFGLAITILGVVAAHRLTAVFLAGTLLLVLLAAAAFGPRRALLLSAGRTLAFTAGLGLVMAFDLRQRAADAGGTLPYTSYLNTKVDVELAVRDLTLLLVAIAVVGVLVLLAARRLPRAVWPALALAIVTTLLAWAWVVHLPLYYSRIVFFLPLPLALLAGAGASALAAWSRGASLKSWADDPGEVLPDGAQLGGPKPSLGRRRAAAASAVVAFIAAVGFTLPHVWKQTDEVRQYYAFASPVSLQVLDELAPRLEPGEIVATDRCWSFLATWLLHTRTYPALEEQDIQPKAELVVARQSAAILHGTQEGRRLIRELPVRYAVLDPTCPVNGERFRPPGELLFTGDRMAVIKLDADAPPPPRRR